MKNLSQFINTLLVVLSCVVAAIFIFGVFKSKDTSGSTEHSTVSSSLSDKPNKDLNAQNALTNKYMKELQIKLKRAEFEAARDLAKSRESKNLPKINKDEDWTKIPIEQQISKDDSFQESTVFDRSTANVRPQKITLNKENSFEFVETARKNGYHVILSETFEVLSITPIMNTKGMNDSFETYPGQ